MIQCPECRSLIPDDSAFCDQCGKELKWCPQCGRPKRGTECPVCGNTLIPGTKWLAAGGDGVTPETVSHSLDPTADAVPPLTVPRVARVSGATPSPADTSSPVMPDPDRASALVGNGWKLIFQEGSFGRVGGIWPELASCPYVSGRHGVIGKSGEVWTITDSGSTNGTFINGSRLTVGAAAPVKKGDSVRIATLDFTVE